MKDVIKKMDLNLQPEEPTVIGKATSLTRGYGGTIPEKGGYYRHGGGLGVNGE